MCPLLYGNVPRPPALAGVVGGGRCQLPWIIVPLHQWLEVGAQLVAECPNCGQQVGRWRSDGELRDAHTLTAIHLKPNEGSHAGRWLGVHRVPDAKPAVTQLGMGFPSLLYVKDKK